MKLSRYYTWIVPLSAYFMFNLNVYCFVLPCLCNCNLLYFVNDQGESHKHTVTPMKGSLFIILSFSLWLGVFYLYLVKTNSLHILGKFHPNCTILRCFSWQWWRENPPPPPPGWDELPNRTGLLRVKSTDLSATLDFRHYFHPILQTKIIMLTTFSDRDYNTF